MASHGDLTRQQELKSSLDSSQSLRMSLVKLASVTSDHKEASDDQAGPEFDFVDSIIKVIKGKAHCDPIVLAALGVANSAIDFSNADTLSNGQMRVGDADEDLLDLVDDLVGLVQNMNLSMTPVSNDEHWKEWLGELRPEANGYLVALAEMLEVEGLAWLDCSWATSEDSGKAVESTSEGESDDEEGEAENESAEDPFYTRSGSWRDRA